MGGMSVESEVTFGSCYLLPLTRQRVFLGIEYIRILLGRNDIQWQVLVTMAVKT
jgi:hypothetical protein